MNYCPSTKRLKAISLEVLNALAVLLPSSLAGETFPEALKVEDTNSSENYRSISIL